MKRLLQFVFLMSICLYCVPSQADYLTHFRKGQELQKQGNHLGAIRQFDLALKIEAKPGATYFKAISLLALRRYSEAKPLFEAVQRHPKTPPVVKNLIPPKLELIKREVTRLAQLKPIKMHVVTPGYPGASVLLNGRIVGLTPLTRFEKPGQYQLIVRKKGFTSHNELVLIKPNQEFRRSVKLIPGLVAVTVRVPGHSNASIKLGGKKLGPGPQTVQMKPGRYKLIVTKSGFETHRETLVVEPGTPLNRMVHLVAAVAPRKSSKTYRLVAYITGGIGLALIVGGGATHGLAVKTAKDADSSSITQKDAINKKNKADKMIKIAYALYGVGGAALITGVVFLVLDLTGKKSTDEKLSQPQFRITPTPHGASASVFLRF